MADIKQAAQWLREGKDVARDARQDRYWVVPFYPLSCLHFEVCRFDGETGQLDLEDLLAEDWIIV
jgi:hypothetical protein